MLSNQDHALFQYYQDGLALGFACWPDESLILSLSIRKIARVKAESAV